MSEESNAASVLRREAVRLKGIIEAADILEKLGAAKQGIDQANAARDSANRERDVARGQLTDAQAKLEAAAAQVTKTLAQAKEGADRIFADAEAQARRVHEEAKKTAAVKTVADLAEADKRLAAVNAEVTRASTRLEGLNAKARDAKEAADVMNEAAASAEKRLAIAQEHIRKTLQAAQV